MSHTSIIAAIKAKQAISNNDSIEPLFLNKLSHFINDNVEMIANSIVNHVYTSNNHWIYIPTDIDIKLFNNLTFMENKILEFVNTLRIKWNVKCITLSYLNPMCLSTSCIALVIQID